MGTLIWRGYLLMAAPVAASWAIGGADEPGSALLAFVLLMLGAGFIGLAVLAPAPVEAVVAAAHEEEEEEDESSDVVADDGDGTDNNHHHQGREIPDAASLAWCGYLLVALPVVASWLGLADEPGAAFLAYALLLLGVGFIGLAVLAPPKLKTL